MVRAVDERLIEGQAEDHPPRRAHCRPRFGDLTTGAAVRPSPTLRRYLQRVQTAYRAVTKKEGIQ